MADLDLLLTQGHAHQLPGILGVALRGGDELRQCLLPGRLHVREADLVVGAARARHGRDDRRQIQLERIRELRIPRAELAEQALRLRVGLDDRRPLRAGRRAEIGDRLRVDGEDADGRAELRAHVRDGGAIGEREARDAIAVKLDELPDDSLVAQHPRHREDQVRRGRARWKLAEQAEADDLRDQQVDRLTEHRRLGLDAADAPPEDADAVDHRRVAIGADQRVRVEYGARIEDDAREVLEIHLMDDALIGWDDLEVVERFLTPPEQLVALHVALELELRVQPEGLGGPEVVDLNGVIDHQL